MTTKHQTETDDAFDENGLLRDGHVHRVRLDMMDSQQKEVHQQLFADATVQRFMDTRRELCEDGLSRAAHSPGYVQDKTRGFAVGMRNDALAQIYQEVEQRDCEAWRGNELIEDEETAYDAALAEIEKLTDVKQRAYALKDLEDATAWQRK